MFYNRELTLPLDYGSLHLPYSVLRRLPAPTRNDFAGLPGRLQVHLGIVDLILDKLIPLQRPIHPVMPSSLLLDSLHARRTFLC